VFISKLKEQVYDVVIIGAGAAGITIAQKIAKQGKLKALLVESGDFEFSAEAAALSAVESEGDFENAYFSVHSQRVFGGTTSVWSNQSSELEHRSFLNNEWPITFNDIHPYYEESKDIITLRDRAFEAPFAAFTPRDIVQYRPYYKSYKRSTRMGPKYRELLEESKNVDVLLNSTCIALLEENQQIREATLRPTKGGADFKVQGGLFVVACGGIGTPRLLQLAGVGQNLPVGNYLMEHPHFIDAGDIEVNKSTLDPVIQTSKTIHAFSLSDKYCLDNKLLNASISFKDHESTNRPLLGVSQNSFYSIASLRTEMPALKSNRTYLLDELDAWGLPKQKVELQLNYTEQAKKIWKIFAKEMLVSNIGRLSVFSDEKVIISGGGHLMGTTRMGDDPSVSVVDKDCQVHGVNNLFIAGSSIFSASAAANPTYSIVAFSLRLFDHISNLLVEKGA